MGHVVDVGQGAGDQNVSLALLREDGSGPGIVARHAWWFAK
jgi:hypothetical protein